jgi:hypothetical protein
MATTLSDSTRTTRRTRVLMTGTLLTPDCAHKVVIRDVSPTGAQVTAPDMIQGNCDAILKRGSLFAAARVAWSDGREAGIRFYRELSEEEIDSTFHPVVLRNVG